jgi:hypothetical protein
MIPLAKVGAPRSAQIPQIPAFARALSPAQSFLQSTLRFSSASVFVAIIAASYF